MAAAPSALGMLRAYRTILRLHRARLPPDVRAIGDAGVHGEFRAWGGSQASAEEWRSFEGEWTRYIEMLQVPENSPKTNLLGSNYKP